ncbi:MAG TPA: hypothetical protein VFO58_17390 [Vicinamibacterales bacterium]|nr:hypothetical protein [Vicinamibacterales bacterium]
MIRQEAESVAAALRRPAVYLQSNTVRKEDVARRLLREHPVDGGLVAVLSCVEPCMTWQMFRSKTEQTQELRRRTGKCLHLYFYFVDPAFGWMHVRVQTWMPYTVQICVNGREWLGRQLDAAGIEYRRADNCFLSLGDVDRAQQIMDRMVDLPWRAVLDRYVSTVSPVLDEIAEHAGGSYRWSLHQCEFATDVMFRSPDALAALYPSLARFAITDLGSKDTMRFLGKPLAATFRGEVVTNYKVRPEGICVRHAAAGNSIKMYDKQGSVLRVETTTNRPNEFKTRRRADGDPDSERKLRPLRKGLADIKARVRASDAANDRYLDALASVDSDKTVEDVLGKVLGRATIGGRPVRALKPWSDPDLALLRAVGRGEFVTNGFRSRDITALLGEPVPTDPDQRRRFMAKLSRQLRLLRAHAVIAKIDGTHRYRVTKAGRTLISAVTAALDASIAKLKQCA